MSDTATMAAFGASERACYDYPDDTEIAKAQRAAFCAGAGWSAVEIERLRTAASLALKRLGELNRDDEAGIRIVLANSLAPQQASGAPE